MQSNKIDYQQAEIALQYLVDTDEQFAYAKSYYDGLYEQRKVVIAIECNKNKGSAAEKLKLAEASEAYEQHLDKLKQAQLDFEILKAKRHTKQLIIDTWRSVNASMKMGNI